MPTPRDGKERARLLIVTRPRLYDFAGRNSGGSSGVAGAVIGQPLDRLGQAVHGSVAVLDGGDHQILDLLSNGAASGSEVPHRLAVSAVEREPLAAPHHDGASRRRAIYRGRASRFLNHYVKSS